MVNTMQQYLAQIQEQLPRSEALRERILSEIEAHLLESWEHELERGVSMEEALAIVLDRFGSPTLIGQQFALLEQERRLWQGKRCWWRASLFLAPLLFLYAIAALSFMGYDAPRLALMHFTKNMENELVAIHAWFGGVLIFGWLVIGGPLGCVISGVQGIMTVKKWSWVTCLNLLCVTLGLALLLFELYSLSTD